MRLDSNTFEKIQTEENLPTVFKEDAKRRTPREREGAFVKQRNLFVPGVGGEETGAEEDFVCVWWGGGDPNFERSCIEADFCNQDSISYLSTGREICERQRGNRITYLHSFAPLQSPNSMFASLLTWQLMP